MPGTISIFSRPSILFRPPQEQRTASGVKSSLIVLSAMYTKSTQVLSLLVVEAAGTAPASDQIPIKVSAPSFIVALRNFIEELRTDNQTKDHTSVYPCMGSRFVRERYAATPLCRDCYAESLP